MPGTSGFALPSAKFVTSLDGVVAPGPEYPFSGSAISGGGDADRFVLGRLRACSDAVLIGAGALRSTPAEMISARRRGSYLFQRCRMRFLVVIDVFQCR
jgi:riboflavin biosynthesis pyrimidine reductase